MLPITISTSDELFSRIHIDDYKRPRSFKIKAFVDFCDLRLHCALQKINRDEMVEGRLTVCE